ncbi:MAG: DUF1858 domain-containing protein [Firmicutes bacterium]|nr:DUF1858 domain-containing protein [Bacillota bacterium]MBQ3611615.1 DUF1858 domain-containing protein [Bacillota bacterium]MBQ4596304.1 DUF1858 domain-containing protein [Bacillota bacterium]
MADIKLTGETRLADLLTAYPWLKNELPNINAKFKMLHTPMGRVMAKKATIAEMSRRSGMDQALLIEKLENLLAG